jgi:hypothetical protein
MAEEREDLPTFDEFGTVVEDITKQQEGLQYSAPRKQIGPKFRGSIPPIIGEQFVDTRSLDEILQASQVERDQEVNTFTSVTGALLSGLIKIPYGALSLTAEIADALKEDDIRLSEGYAAKLEKTFKDSVLGKVATGAEEVARETAAGALTEMFTQLYGSARMGAGYAVKAAAKAKKIANNYINAAKVNKVVTPNKNLAKAQLKANQMNELSGLQKFSAVAVGGGAGTAMVTDIEPIGSWGDTFGGPTKLDKQIRPTAKDDAIRKLANRFRVGVEDIAVTVPVIYGAGLLGKLLSKHGEEIAFSNSEIERLADKLVGKPFRPRGSKAVPLYEGLLRAEGQIAASTVTAKDLIMDIDKSLYNISKEAGIGKGTTEIKKLVENLNDLLVSGDDVVKNGKLTFTTFPPKKLNKFETVAKEIGLNPNQTDNLVNEMMKVRNQMNIFKNTLFKGGNINVVNKEFGKIMSERMRNTLASDYEIFTDKGILGYFKYKPTADAMDQLKNMFKRYAVENKAKLDDYTLDIMVKDVINNIQPNPLTKTPQFTISRLSVLDDKATQLVNIADNIVGGKFKPTSFVKTKEDLKQLQNLFGQKKDLRNTITNTMQDLGTLMAKDEFYQNILKTSEDLIKEGKRSIVYPTHLEAVRNFPNKTIISSETGLTLQSPLKEDILVNPLNGKFTTTEYRDALNFTENLLMDNIAKNVFYQNLLLVPKGLTQISKTVLSPFATTRNFLTSSLFSLGTGNLTKNPVTTMRNFKKAWGVIQPQLAADDKLWKKAATLGLSYRNTPESQRFYKFLLEENVVQSSTNAKEISAMMDDMSKGLDMYDRFFGLFGKVSDLLGSVGRGVKNSYELFQKLYIAGDDQWKVFNVLQENDTYTNAYKAAFKKGIISKMPSELEILKKATKIVRNTVPNYSRVGDFVKNMRKTPLSNFSAFPTEVTRTSYNIMELGLEESADPVLSYVGKKRLISFGATVAGAIPITNHILRGLYGGTEEIESAVRILSLAPFAKGTSLFMTKDEDGNWKYMDASGAFVYDTITRPIQSVIAQTATDRTFKNDPNLKASVYEGITQGFKRFIAPYFEPSIWYETMLSLWARNGVTAEGSKIWNEEDLDGDKWKKALEYTFKNVAPLSAPQMERLILSLQDKPNIRGKKFDTFDELAGLYGLRSMKVIPKENIDYKINDFKKGIRNTRSLLTGETLKGGEISSNDIISRYITANAQRYKVMNKMATEIQAGYVLDMDAKTMRKVFAERGERNALSKIARGYFYPFEISSAIGKKYKEQYEKLASEFDELTFDMPYDKATKDTIKELQRAMKQIPLGADFYEYINPKDWLFDDKRSSLPGASGERQVTQVPPLPEQPMPNPQVVTPPAPPMAQMSQLNQGLTPFESALLSEEDKQLRLKQRGLA